MRRPAAPQSPFLKTVDALCVELQRTCGLTRFTIVIERRSRPLTVTFETQFHVGIRSRSTAVLRLDLRDGDRTFGYVTLENALADSYSDAVRQTAAEVVGRHAAALAGLLRDAMRVPILTGSGGETTE